MAVIIAAMVVAMAPGVVFAVDAQTWESVVGLRMVSVTEDGENIPEESRDPDVDMSGRYVVFESYAPLVEDDGNGRRDIYLHDTGTNRTTRVSVAMDGGDPDGNCDDARISADGRYVVYESWASNLSADDRNSRDPDRDHTNGARDIFRYDTHTGETELVSAPRDGAVQWDHGSRDADISADGRYVVLFSGQDFLEDDTNDEPDIYVKDMVNGTWEMFDVSDSRDLYDFRISGNGRYVVFYSYANDIVPGDTNGYTDIFVLDTETGIVDRVSEASDGTQANDYSWYPRIDHSGRYVVFESDATNLVDEDTNGYRNDVFWHDVETGETRMVSASQPDTRETQRGSRDCDISADGMTVVFFSGKDLSAEDEDTEQDIYLADMADDSYRVVEVQSSWGGYANDTEDFALSGDASSFAFTAEASNLVPGDTDGDEDVFFMRLDRDLGVGAMRWAGPDRYATAVEVSKELFPRGAGHVVIATGEDWPDALCGSSLAGAVDAPILLVRQSEMPDMVKAEIERLGATDAYVLGGTGAVCADIEEQLEEMLSGSVNRIDGFDRYETAALIAEETVDVYGDRWDGTVLVATGGDFADAVAGAPLASGLGYPIMLARPMGHNGSLDPDEEVRLDMFLELPDGAQEAVILGGTGAVPDEVETALKRSTLANDEVIRIGGDTRYDTAAMAAQFGVDRGLLWDGVGLATGELYPDGLTGGAALGLQRTVLLLTPSSDLTWQAHAKLETNAASIDTMVILGGEAAMTPSVKTAAETAAGL